MDENSIIGNNIRIAREHKGYTQEQLAEKLNTSSKFVSMAERGASGLSVSSMINLCKVLDIEPNSLFSGIINYNNDVDKQIINNLSLLSNEDKDFILNTITFIRSKRS